MHLLQLRSPAITRVSVAALAASLILLLAGDRSDAQTPQSGCQLNQPAFCETFDAPSPLGAGTRSGNLDGILWGVSRATNNDNPSQGQLYAWSATSHSTCGSPQTVAPEQDVLICNGQLVESVSDAGQDTLLALYPRQPFDIAGRTGIATFDVNNDTQGPHAAWPAFVYTDQPVPAPYGQAAGLADNPRNSFGFSIATPNCNGDPNLIGVDAMWTTTNYQLTDQPFTTVGCIHRSTTTTQLNHFEVHLSQSHVELWGTDPGVANLHQLAIATFSMPLSRGLIWIEDVHYNACKFNSQCNHTFVWDNVGFDGPILPRDLGFDVLDATHTSSTSGNLGYLVPAGGSLSLQIPNVSGLQNASAALLEFTFWPHVQDSLTYAVNGHPAHSQPWPFGANGITYSSQTIALPVPLAELQNGTNSVILTSSDSVNGGLSIANIDLILVGAGGVAAPPTGAAPAPTQAPTSTSSPSPMATSSAKPTQVAAVTPTSVVVATHTSTPTPVPASVNTPALTPASGATRLVGNSTIHAQVDTDTPGTAEAFGYEASQSGIARHISLFVDRTNRASQIVVGIYSNDAAANVPGLLLGQARLSNPSPGTWNTVSLPAVQITSGNSYWIAILGPRGSGAVQFRDAVGGAPSRGSAQSNLTSLPTRWTTGLSWGSAHASVYAAR